MSLWNNTDWGASTRNVYDNNDEEKEWGRAEQGDEEEDHRIAARGTWIYLRKESKIGKGPL